MKTLQVNSRPLIGCALAAMFLAPTFAWSHGAVDVPISRNLKCYIVSGYWSSEDGSSISDKGCRNAALEFPSGPDRAYQMDQWAEIAKLIGTTTGYTDGAYNDQGNVEKEIPNGTLCSAGDPKKAGLSAPNPDWTKTSVTPVNGKIKVRLGGTQPHVDNFMEVYVSKSTYNPAERALNWDDLIYLGKQDFKVARTDWNPLPFNSSMQGFFEMDVDLKGRTGDAVLFTRWQRIDPHGEGFYNCSDIRIEGATNPFPWFEKGAYIPQSIQPKAGETVRFRVLDDTPAIKEIVDITVPITESNVSPAVWGKQLADQLASSANIIKVGVRKENAIVFDAANIKDNLVYLANDKNSTHISIGSGGGGNPDPGQPVKAVIVGPTAMKAGETVTFTAVGSTGKAPLTYQWWNNFTSGKGEITTAPTVTYTAPATDEKGPGFLYWVHLSVVDANKKGTSSEKPVHIDFTGSGGGGDYPAYTFPPATPYKAGDIVSNGGANYECKGHPYTAWCSGAKAFYEPGIGQAWQQAWTKK